MGAYFMERLIELKNRHTLIADIRGRGLMIGMELFSKSKTAGGDNIAFTMAMLCERKGLHITYSYFEPVIRLLPPLIISRDEIDKAVDILDEVLNITQSGNSLSSRYAPQNKRSGPFIKRLNGSLSTAKVLQKMWTTSPQRWIKKLSHLSTRA
jgi:hypothetical protein